MGFTVIPTSVGGASLNSLTSPLAALLTPTGGVQNMTYPSDLGSNPSMGHAVIIQAYDYTTDLQQQAVETVDTAVKTTNNTIDNFSKALNSGGNLVDTTTNIISASTNAAIGIGKTIAAGATTIGYLTQSPKYTPRKKGNPLMSASLFMPDSLSVNYNSTYSEVSMTDELGGLGFLGNAIADINLKDLKETATPYAVGGLSSVVGKLIGGENTGAMLSQALGQYTNPQMQLLYRGIDLRTFQLDFIMTPKSSAEAETIKNICDSFTFYSLPGLAGAQTGNSGQFLTPPQLFSIQFKFLGQNSVIGSATNVISSALTNSGLGFLTSSSNITNGNASKTFSVGDCVLESVAVDYTPNGWATYNDGYPVQTRLSLQFKESQMLTKQYFKGTSIESNYNNQQFQNNNQAAAQASTLSRNAGNID